VPPGDARAFAAAVQDLAGDPAARHRMGAAGIQRVAASWDLDTGADRIYRLLRATLPSTAGAGAAITSSVPS